jgi:hypothetical protein
MPVISDAFDEKVIEAFNVSLDVMKLDLADMLKLTQEQMETVYGHADGLSAKWYEKIGSMRCSLQATIDFDVAKEFEDLKAEIEMMKGLLIKHSLKKD